MVSRRSFLIGSANVAIATGLGVGCSPDEAGEPGEQAGSTATDPPPSTSTPRSTFDGADLSGVDALLADTNGQSFVLVEHGRTVHEWHLDDESSARDVASAQKSVLSLLVGRAVADGLVELDTEIDAVLGRGWTDHGETAGITVRHLLTMTSGLDDSLAVVAAPGERWIYSGAFAQLFDVLEEVTGDDLGAVAADWLFEPTGTTGARFYERRVTGYAPIGLWASTAAMAAIGVAVADRSIPGLGDDWYEESFSPSQEHNRAYGLLWWLNGQASYRLPGQILGPRQGSLIPPAPDDMVAALGKDDQKLYVSAELGLVASRLGDRAAPRARAALSSFDADLWTAILAARQG